MLCSYIIMLSDHHLTALVCELIIVISYHCIIFKTTSRCCYIIRSLCRWIMQTIDDCNITLLYECITLCFVWLYHRLGISLYCCIRLLFYIFDKFDASNWLSILTNSYYNFTIISNFKNFKCDHRKHHQLDKTSVIILIA